MKLFPSGLVVLDTETTGFVGSDWAGVVELAAVYLSEEGEERHSWETLVKPPILDDRADPAFKVNGIPRALVESAPSTEAVAEAFDRWLIYFGIPYCSSFNVGFDRPMVERMGVTQARWAHCIMLRAAKAMGQERWPKLKDAARFFGIPPCEPAHRALADARTAARIAVEIKRREVERREVEKQEREANREPETAQRTDPGTPAHSRGLPHPGAARPPRQTPR